MERLIYLTDYDYERLELLLSKLNNVSQNRRGDLSQLENDLAMCQIVKPEEMPDDVVTLNSKVRYFDLDNKQERIVTLVFPSTADLSKGRVSIAAPIGAAILGCSEGETVSWTALDGKTVSVKIEEVLYQPEAAGDYHL